MGQIDLCLLATTPTNPEFPAQLLGRTAYSYGRLTLCMSYVWHIALSETYSTPVQFAISLHLMQHSTSDRPGTIIPATVSTFSCQPLSYNPFAASQLYIGMKWCRKRRSAKHFFNFATRQSPKARAVMCLSPVIHLWNFKPLGIILCMRPANERRRYNVMSALIGWAHALNAPCTFVTWHGPLARYVKLWFAHAPGMPGTFSPPPQVSDPDMQHGTCVTHVPWCIPGSLISGFLWSRWRGRNVTPAFPAHAQPAILPMW